MAKISIVDPWAAYPIGWTWAQHRAAGYAGGTDYVVPAGVPVRAAADGVASLVGDIMHSIVLHLADGRAVTYRENRSVAGSFPRRVKQGDVIGYSGLIRGGALRWPHIEGETAQGIRVPFEPMVTSTLSTAGTGPVTPITDPKPPTITPTKEHEVTLAIIHSVASTSKAPNKAVTITVPGVPAPQTVYPGRDYLWNIESGQVAWLKYPNEEAKAAHAGLTVTDESCALIAQYALDYGVIPGRSLS